MTNTKKKIIAILGIILVVSLTIGGTLAYLTDSESITNKFSIKDLDIVPDEPNWTPGDGDDLQPGDTKIKDPTITAVENDSYMRVIVTIIDQNETIPNPAYTVGGTAPKEIANPNKGEIITDQARLSLILATIYYDPTYNVNNTPATSGLLPTGKYSLANLVTYKTVNEASFTYNSGKSTPGTYYYDYKNTTTNNVFKEDSSVVLFSNIVIPTDWNQTHMNVLGKYDVTFLAQAIQAKHFTSATDAFIALDAEIAAGTIQVNYGETYTSQP